MSSVMLYSGGMDCLIASRLHPADKYLFIDYQGNYTDIDFEYAKKTAPSQMLIDTTTNLGSMEDEHGIIEQRNLNFITIAARYGDEIMFSSPRGEHYYDQKKWFYFCAGLAAKRKISNPIGNKTKAQLVKEFLEAGHDVELLKKSRSCYSNEDVQCGKCSACLKRYVAMTLNGIEEEYQNNPLDFVDRIRKRVRLKDVLTFDLRSAWEIRKVLKGAKSE